ncbi:serine/threonine-protein phosphatase CPPED1-like isoform X2 [Sipha flava]|nr:serine/threonine-protein phosphatase CPPED1-like isoform X2 [Sipha flava]
MTENKVQTSKWKKHEIEENIGHEKYDNDIYQLQVNDFMKIFSNLHPSISLVCVCGNHDVGNIPDEKSIDQYRHNFGHDYFSFWCGGVLFLVLNSQYYTSCSNVKELSEKQDKWLTEKLNTHKGQRIIIFQHVPWFIDNIEDNKYFNIDTNLKQEMLEKMNSAGVSHVFCGHCHRNCNRYYKNLEIVTTNAIGATASEDPSGLRVVKVYENNVIHTYYPLDQLPETVG